MAFDLRPFGQINVARDFEIIRELANRQVPYDLAGNEEWLRKRMGRRAEDGKRFHAIVINAHSEAIGYLAVEQQGLRTTLYRLYLVFDPGQWTFADLGTFMYQRAMEWLRREGAEKVFMIEYDRDPRFTEFLLLQGFSRGLSANYHGFAVTRYEQDVEEFEG